MKRISHLLLLSVFLASCANAVTPTPNVTVTSQVTVTFTPAPTSTATEVPPTPTETPDPNRPLDATGKDEYGYYKEMDGVKYRQLELPNDESLWAFSMVNEPNGELHLWYYSPNLAAIPFQIFFADPQIQDANAVPLISQYHEVDPMSDYNSFFTGSLIKKLPGNLKKYLLSNGQFDSWKVLDAMNKGEYLVHFDGNGDQTETGPYLWNLKHPAKVVFRNAETSEMPSDTVRHHIIGNNDLAYYARYSDDGQSLLCEVFLSSFDGFTEKDVMEMILAGMIKPISGTYYLSILSKNSGQIFIVDN